MIKQSGKAVVKPVAKIQVSGSELINWLYASILYSSDRDQLSIDNITSDPVWYPFEILPGYFNLTESQFIQVVHQSAETSLVSIRPNSRNTNNRHSKRKLRLAT